MRKIIYNAQTTLNNRIATQNGDFWEPFPWGDTEQAFANKLYAGTDTWVLTRTMFEAIVPWWETVAQGNVPEDVEAVSETYVEFANLLAGMRKIAISRTMTDADGREVIGEDIAPQLQSLREEPGSEGARSSSDTKCSAPPADLGDTARRGSTPCPSIWSCPVTESKIPEK